MKKIFYTLIIFFLSCGLTSAQRQKNSQVQMEYDKLGYTLDAINYFYVEEVNNTQLVEEAIKAMLEKLDPHSTYTNAEDTRRMNEPLEANFDGIGISFDMILDTLYIVQVNDDGPSKKVGLLPGDRIIKVNDSIIAGVKMVSADVMKLIKGQKGTSVKVTVKRETSPNLLSFTIIRDNIPVNSIDAMYMADANTGYIRLIRFSNSTMQEFKTALSQLQKKGMKNLIIDLQENGGGYLQIAAQLTDQFLEKGKLIVYTQGDKINRSDAISTDQTLFKDGKLVLLINEASASASEILAGAIQDWDRGVIVGRRSYGKGLIQRAIDLPDHSMIRLTVGRYYTPSGRFIQKPYEKGNSDAYKHDIIDRYNNGELTNADSIHFPDSLKFQTLVSKRTVYGGGGIMPDIFVPFDSTRISEYHAALRRYRLPLRVSVSYVNKNRKELSKNYPDFNRFKNNFTVTEAIFEQIRTIAEEHNIKFDDAQYESSKELLSLEIKAHIANYLFSNSEYYQIMNDRNETYLKALQVINDDKQYLNILSGNLFIASEPHPDTSQ